MRSHANLSTEVPPMYRWTLTRRWVETWDAVKAMTFIMLNPSTADAYEDDPTIRRCIGFAQRERCGELRVINLFSYRATEPDDLLGAIRAGVDPFGSRHDEFTRHALALANGPIVAAWGANELDGHVDAAIRRLRENAAVQMGTDTPMLSCLKVTKSGAPGHPLYLPADAPLTDWGTL